MQIKIKDKSYDVKYTIRALFIFEQITGKAFEIKTLLDNYIFLYSIILANNQQDPLQWDDFIDAIDNDKSLLDSLNAVIDRHNEVEEFIGVNDDESDSDEKKN